MKFRENPVSGDPSSIQQSFENINLNVHCCRYWWMKQWKHQRLSFPYWRLYWNKIPGAFVFFEDQTRDFILFANRNGFDDSLADQAVSNLRFQ